MAASYPPHSQVRPALPDLSAPGLSSRKVWRGRFGWRSSGRTCRRWCVTWTRPRARSPESRSARRRSSRRGQQIDRSVANHLAASAAYLVAPQADELVASPSSLLVSIGVFAMHEDVSGRLADGGVAITLISVGTYETEGNPIEPLTVEAPDHIP